jgi:prevent-host-death family protein
MLRVNITQAKARLSELLRRVKAGQSIIISVRNVPIAELRPLPRAISAARSLDPVWPGWTVPDSFFEPLAEETLATFEGKPAGMLPTRD